MLKFFTTLLLVSLMLPTFASETVKGARKDLDKFKQEMSVELQDIENKLKKLSEDSQKKGSAAYKQTIQDLNKSREKLRSDLYDLEADAKGEWKEAKSELSKSIDKLNSRIQEALKD
ncbi:MAG: hypothetical protein NDI69_05205 [Bacteriovoracaceae bacterium]|nr:hypothetical protein [Bacteriovoracaceae bacterium]